MKYINILILAILFSVANVYAQKTDSVKVTTNKFAKKKFFNINYSTSKLTPKGELKLLGEDEEDYVALDKNFSLKSDWGVSLVQGRTYTFHRKPIFGFLNLGLDVSFLDLNYTQYSPEKQTGGGEYVSNFDDDDDESSDEKPEKMHKIEYGWQIGPSITFTPLRKLTIATYFRYAPTYSSIYYDGSYMGNYSTQFRTGASIAYGSIGCGVEASFGDCEYKKFLGDLEFKGKMKSSGGRVYIQFRW